VGFQALEQSLLLASLPKESLEIIHKNLVQLVYGTAIRSLPASLLQAQALYIELDTKYSTRVALIQVILNFGVWSDWSRPAGHTHFWADLLSAEYFAQGDLTRLLGLALEPFMDRDQPNVSLMSECFVKYIAGPLATVLKALFTNLNISDPYQPVPMSPMIPDLEGIGALIETRSGNFSSWGSHTRGLLPAFAFADESAD